MFCCAKVLFIIFYTACEVYASEPINPFKPLFKNSSARLEDMKKNIENISPLEKYDIGSLRLSAILQSGKKIFAIVEDTLGRGYLIVKGSRIGSDSSIVVDISLHRVIIENISGIKKEMVLNKAEK